MAYTALESVRKELADPYRFGQDIQTGDGSTSIFKLSHGRVQDGTFTILVNTVPMVENSNFTIDIETGVITFLTPPTNGVTIEARYYFSAFSDEELENFLEEEGDNVLKTTLRAINILLMDAARRFDYSSGQTEVKPSQVFEHLYRLRDVFKERIQSETNSTNSGVSIVDRVHPAYESEVETSGDLSRDDLGL